MLNLSEIHPDVRKTLHKTENALVRDVSANVAQGSVGTAIKDTYAKAPWVRMFSPINSTQQYAYYTKKDAPPENAERHGKLLQVGDIKLGTDGKGYMLEDNPRGGMDGVCIVGGELVKDTIDSPEDALKLRTLNGFSEMYDRVLWDKQASNELTYDTGGKVRINEDRFRPLPGITSVSVEFAGGTKAIRNATINWVCHSYSDVARLQPHFLGHGKPIMLEWGWSSIEDFNAIQFFSKDEIQSGEAYNTIQSRIWANKGKYDAMAGLVKNFEWKTRDDGGFDCTTEVTSLGVNTLGQQTKSEVAPSTDPEEKTTEEKEKEGGSTIGGYTPTLEEFVEQLDDEIVGLCMEPGVIFGNAWKSVRPITDQPPGIMKTILTDGINRTVGPYVSWGWMEDNIISKFLGKVNTDGRLFSTFRSVIPVMENGKPKEIGDEGGEESWRWESVRICNHEGLLTSNPDRFIFKGQWVTANNIDISKDYDTEKITQMVKDFEDAGDGKSFDNFACPDNPEEGFLRNVIIHWEEIKESFIGVTSIESGMQNLFNRMNEDYGIWKLKVTDATLPSTKHGAGRVMVIDENHSENTVENLLETTTGVSKLVDGKVEGKLFVFNVMNEKSIVKGHSLTAKLPSSMQTAAMFGANNKGNAPAVAGNPSSIRYGKAVGKHPDQSIGDMKMAWQYGSFGYNGDRDSIDNIISDANSPLSVDDGPPLLITAKANAESTDVTTDDNANKARDEALEEEKNKLAQEKEFQTNIDKIKNNETISTSKHDDKKMYNDKGYLKDEGEYKWKSIMRKMITTGPTGVYNVRPLLIPLEIEIQVTGIGGIVPGNAFTTSYLPPEYDGWVAFQATDISHSIGTDGWTTTIRGLMRMAEHGPTVIKGDEITIVKKEGHAKIAQNVNLDETGTVDPPTTDEVTEAEHRELETEEAAESFDNNNQVPRPKIPIPSEEEDILDDLPIDEDWMDEELKVDERLARGDIKPTEPPPVRPKIEIPSADEDIEGDVDEGDTSFDEFEDFSDLPEPPPPAVEDPSIPPTYDSWRIDAVKEGEYTTEMWTVTYEAVQYKTFTDGSVRETNRGQASIKKKDRESADRTADQAALGTVGHWRWTTTGKSKI